MAVERMDNMGIVVEDLDAAIGLQHQPRRDEAVHRAGDGEIEQLRIDRTEHAGLHPFVDQRVILVGDAAHVVHPLAGQGVNLGFEDISALLASVARARAAQRAPFGDSDLLRWGRERRSEATLAARAFDGLNRLYGVAEGPLVAARALGLRVIDHLPPVKRKLAERAAGIRAGAS